MRTIPEADRCSSDLKAPFKQQEIWAPRVKLEMEQRARDLALFNLGIDSKPRACDLTGLRIRDLYQGGQVSKRAIVLQRKTKRPVQFEITAPAEVAEQTEV